MSTWIVLEMPRYTNRTQCRNHGNKHIEEWTSDNLYPTLLSIHLFSISVAIFEVSQARMDKFF